MACIAWRYGRLGLAQAMTLNLPNTRMKLLANGVGSGSDSCCHDVAGTSVSILIEIYDIIVYTTLHFRL